MSCEKCQKAQKHLSANLLKVAEFIEQRKSRRNINIAQEIVIGYTGISAELVPVARKHFVGWNWTFEVAQSLLRLSEDQAVLLFFFWATDDQMAYFTSRNEAEKQFIADWRSAKSVKQRRELVVKVIRYYAEKWTQETTN